jgi:hypothetical protein
MADHAVGLPLRADVVGLRLRELRRADDTAASARATAAAYCSGSICRRNWPLVTMSPSFTASRTMRPLMSAATSTLMFGRPGRWR